MDQQVRFLETSHGRLAYAVTGEGPPMLFPSWWMGHLELMWEHDEFRRFLEALAARHTVVRYDPLGTGLSERQRADSDFTLELELEVLEALVAELELGRCLLFGFSSGGPIAIAYAARHPTKVSRLILYGTYARGAEITDEGTKRSLLQVVDQHWGLGPRILTSLFIPDAEAELAKFFARFQRAAADPETASRMLGLAYALDVSDVVGEVTAPALVLHRRGDLTIRYELGVDLASRLPDAELKSLDGNLHFPWLGDTASVLDAVAEFTHLGPYPLAGKPPEAVIELSEREREVMGLVAEGLGDREIAERLILSPHTVHRHVANVRTKLGQPSRAAALAECYRLRLI